MLLKSNISYLFSIILSITVLCIVFLDLRYVFGNYDTPFFLVLVCGSIYIMLNRTTSKLSFMVALLFLVIMAFSFVISGAVRFTERSGEWFYVFFVLGLIQYCKESFFP